MPEKIDYFQGVGDHYESLEVKIIEVPEWGLEGDKAMYVRPFTMNEKQRIFKGANDSDYNVLIDVIIQKAEDKNGERMFTLEHKPKFKIKADTDIISRVASEILATESPVDLKKK